MNRSGFVDENDGDNWSMICWCGAVASAFRGRRGQAFLREMLAALDAMSEHRLIVEELERRGEVCALGAVGKARSLDMSEIDPEDYDAVADKFGVAGAMARQIMYENDYYWREETPEQRWTRMRAWVVGQIR